MKEYIRDYNPVSSEMRMFGRQRSSDQMSYKVLEVQPTPNPNAMKFVLNREIASQPASFFSANAAEGHSLARQLFEVAGVTSILVLGDFVTVNKSDDTEWKKITPKIKAILGKYEG